MKTFLLFALALVMSSGVLAQEPANETELQEKTEKTTAVPSTIDFQGRLHDSGGNPVNATLSITFSLYSVSTSGTALWTETKSVQITEGLFQVKLGEVTPLTPTHFSGADRWLGIKVGTEAEMSPRTKISSVGYAMQSEGSSNIWTISENDIYYDAGNVGIGTNNPIALLNIQGNETGGGNVLFAGEYKATDPGDPPATGEGTRMMWYPDKAAFRAGRALSNYWDKENIGNYSFATGYGTTASGDNSTAMGLATTASGDNSTAMGFNTTASGNYSTAMGLYTNALGVYSNAMGYFSIASGAISIAMGRYTVAEAFNSTAIGSYNIGGGNATAWFDTDPLFEIGIGTSDTDRKNAFTVLKNGKVGIGTNSPEAGLHVLSSNTGVLAGATAASGITYGGHFKNFSTSGRGVLSEATATSGSTYGGYFISNSSSGTGVMGSATATYGLTHGGYFKNASINGIGIFSQATASTGNAHGGWFETFSSDGTGVIGWATAESGNTFGGDFESVSTSGIGVRGMVTALSGTNYGGYFTCKSASGYGAYGQSPKYGIFGKSTGNQGRAVTGEATGTASIGLRGVALNTNSTGVWGEGSNYDFYANGPGVDYGSGSSIRWKRNIIAIPDPLEKIASLRGVYFDWDEEYGGRHDIGMIAEEVGKVLPEIVIFEENGIDAMGMDYSKIGPLLVEAVKALKSENDRLKQDNLEVNARLERLERALEGMAQK